MATPTHLEKVKELLAQGKTEPAADLLLQLSKAMEKEHYHSALLLKNRLETLQHQVIEGVLSQSEERVEWARVSKGVMELVMQIERKEQPAPEEKTGEAFEKKKPEKGVKAWWFVLPLVLVLGVFAASKFFRPASQPVKPPPKREEPAVKVKMVTVPGRVVSPGGRFVPDAEVVFEFRDKKYRARTDQNGQFKVKVPEAIEGKHVELTISMGGQKKVEKTIKFWKAALKKGLKVG